MNLEYFSRIGIKYFLVAPGNTVDSNITMSFFFISLETNIHADFKSFKSGLLFFFKGVGTAIINVFALIISLITVTKQKKDFRHGFEIALSYSIYSAFLVVIVFLLEHYLELFSKLSFFLASILGGKISLLKVPNFVDLITSQIINLLFEKINKFALLLFAFVILTFTLKYLGKSIIEVLGGEDKAKKFINKYFDSKYKSYFIGVFLTAIVFSSSITIGLLVPLAVSRLISLKKAIPFILGADLGTASDVFLASIIIGKTTAYATSITYTLFGIIGALIFLPNVNFLQTTKYVSKKLIKISRKKALYILIAFILIPLGIILIS